MKIECQRSSGMLAWFMGAILLLSMGTPFLAEAIDIAIPLDEAKKIIAMARDSMEKATSFEELRAVAIEAERPYLIHRPDDDITKDPCLPHAVVQTKRFWLETLGRREAAESKRQHAEVRVPEEKIHQYLAMPNLGVEVRLCGEEEYFAEGAEVVLQQGSEFIRPVDFVPPKAGRRIPGPVERYRTRLTARFAYESFNPAEPAVVAVFFPDGTLINLEADFPTIH